MYPVVIMENKLIERLNKIESKITSSSFLENQGLGNEISFYIFDYPPEYELKVREYIDSLVRRIKKKGQINLLHINLFDLLLDYLKDRDLLQKAYELEQTKGPKQLLEAFKGPLNLSKIVSYFESEIAPQSYDLVLLSGVGGIWPLVRSHSLLNNLQPIMGNTPLVLFYPGGYDEQTLKLFNRITSNNYYRAFRLIPEESVI
jgi:hypothetical protein